MGLEAYLTLYHELYHINSGISVHEVEHEWILLFPNPWDVCISLRFTNVSTSSVLGSD